MLNDKGYKGIKARYPKISSKFDKLSDFIQLLRPMTVVIPFLVTIIGVLTQMSLGGVDLTWSKVPTIIYAGVTLALSQAAGQVINQYADVDIDKVNKPYRPIPRGTINKNTALGIGLILMLISLGRGFLTNAVFGTINTILLFFAIFYSLEPIRVKKTNEWLALSWLATSRGFLPFLAVWSVFGGLGTVVPYVLGSIGFAWIFAFQGTKDILDFRGDDLHDIPTLATKYGIPKTKRIMTGLSVIPIVMTLVYVVTGLLQPAFMVLFGALFAMVAIVDLELRDIKRDIRFENCYAWIGLYVGLAGLYVFAFVSTLLV